MKVLSKSGFPVPAAFADWVFQTWYFHLWSSMQASVVASDVPIGDAPVPVLLVLVTHLLRVPWPEWLSQTHFAISFSYFFWANHEGNMILRLHTHVLDTWLGPSIKIKFKRDVYNKANEPYCLKNVVFIKRHPTRREWYGTSHFIFHQWLWSLLVIYITVSLCILRSSTCSRPPTVLWTLIFFVFLVYYRHDWAARQSTRRAARLRMLQPLAGLIFPRRLHWRHQRAPFNGPRFCCTTVCMRYIFYCYYSFFFYLSTVWRVFIVRPVACVFVDGLSLCITIFLPMYGIVLWCVRGPTAPVVASPLQASPLAPPALPSFSWRGDRRLRGVHGSNIIIWAISAPTHIVGCAYCFRPRCSPSSGCECIGAIGPWAYEHLAAQGANMNTAAPARALATSQSWSSQQSTQSVATLLLVIAAAFRVGAPGSSQLSPKP